jgi:hypothetical protein
VVQGAAAEMAGGLAAAGKREDSAAVGFDRQPSEPPATR